MHAFALSSSWFTAAIVANTKKTTPNTNQNTAHQLSRNFNNVSFIISSLKSSFALPPLTYNLFPQCLQYSGKPTSTNGHLSGLFKCQSSSKRIVVSPFIAVQYTSSLMSILNLHSSQFSGIFIPTIVIIVPHLNLYLYCRLLIRTVLLI